jgi:GNAT superfamily N-acetyltransferase
MPTITIRPATPADVSLVLAFVRELAEYEKAADQVVATEALLREDLFGPRPVCEAILGEIDGVPQGFALFFHNFSTWVGRRGIYLEDLFVRPPARGLGLGARLLSRVAAIACERGCARLDWAVLDWNEPAIGFYKKLGARALTEWTTFRLTGESLRALAERSP